MDRHVSYRCEQHPDPYDCPDCLLIYVSKFDEYGIIRHNGGRSFCSIQFCPFCGAKLPESKRDEWFEKLEALGYEDPFFSDVPEEFETDAWFRNSS